MMRWIGLSLMWCVAVAALVAQAPDSARRVEERIRALQRESEELARQTQTLVGDLRKLEVERDLRVAQAKQAETAAAEAAQTLERATARLAALEQERIAQLPDLELQLVDVYKRGRTGYARLLFGAEGLREFARTTRAVSALASINERRLAEHRATLAALSTERATLQKTAAELDARGAAARSARIAAERAVAARAAL